MSWIKNCENTLKAKWWEVLKAKLFGIKCISIDCDAKVTSYRYKDMVYVTKVEKVSLFG